jgi:hypothetical protein
LHTVRGYNLQPMPDSQLFRVVGSQVYEREIWDGELTSSLMLLDFGSMHNDTTQYVPLMKEKDTTMVAVPAGTFANAVILRSGFRSNFYDIYAPGVGLLLRDYGELSGVDRLIKASIGGKQYP